MKYVFQFLRILTFCFLGEVLRGLLPLPIPASIYGLALLLAALKAGLVRLELGPVLAASWLPVALAVALVTVLVMAAAGRVTQAVSRRKAARHG